MGEVKEINIENQTYYFFNVIIDIRNFHSNLLKTDKKPYKYIDIYYIGYITSHHYAKIGISTDNDLPLNVSLKFPALTIIIRCAFQEGKKKFSTNLFR